LIRALAAALVLLCAWAGTARADEVFELDNGMVLRGTSVRESATEVVVRLSGLSSEARVTVETARIVRRRPGNMGRPAAPTGAPLARATDLPSSGGVDVPSLGARTWTPPTVEAEPLEEPGAHREGFFERLRRVALMAMPNDIATRIALGTLFFAALLALVGLGGRLLEIEGLSLARTGVLAGALGVMVLSDALYRDMLLRADRAPWVVPAQAAVWLALTFGIVRCTVPKAVLLLAFLLFSLAVVSFTAGAVLVAF
jgi:hypothetical protein